jgi:hypothetical protein
MKDIDKFKKLFDEVEQQYIENEDNDTIFLSSDEGGWDCCEFSFKKEDGKFKGMHGFG